MDTAQFRRTLKKVIAAERMPLRSRVRPRGTAPLAIFGPGGDFTRRLEAGDLHVPPHYDVSPRGGVRILAALTLMLIAVAVFVGVLLWVGLGKRV